MKRTGWKTSVAIVATVWLMACRQSSPVSVVESPSATSSSVATTASPPAASPTPPHAYPLPTPTQRGSVFGACRLPVEVPGDDDRPLGWLDVPAGTYTPDPAGAAAVIQERKSSVQVVGDLTWDPAVGKWLPALPRWISRDGTRYVSGNLEVVDAATGRIVHRISTTPFPNEVVAYIGSAIYMQAIGKDPPPGLWKLDTTSWRLTKISSADANWELVDTQSAWGVYGFTVRRLDLSAGKVTDLYRGDPNSDWSVSLLGFVGSGVLVVTTYQGIYGIQVHAMVVLHADGSTAPIDVPPDLQDATLDGVQDGAAFIFTVTYPLSPGQPSAYPLGYGLAAWDPDRGLQFVMTKAPEGYSIAGPCMAV